ncbi:MAG: T3SS effector cysteine hydrolase SpvD family protein [Rhabdochlamydiaceae bacterium]|nr:T3SS effector cysteine hydrolase SpvD family protein [Candidatus Amphrikana amoebophyrae]
MAHIYDPNIYRLELALAQGNYFNDSNIESSQKESFSRKLPSDVAKKLNKQHLPFREQRVKSALYSHEVCRKIDLNSLDKRTLFVIAKRLNKKTVICSANCALISRVFLYNMAHEQERLSVGNPSLPFLPLLGRELKSVLSVKLLKENIPNVKILKEQLLACYHETKETVFEIGYLRKLPITDYSVGHNFNAVILFDSENKPYVQLVDAWAKSNPTPNEQQVAKKYHKGRFSIAIADHRQLYIDNIET